jgi:predicted DNA-binding transcriptional regulator YafY
MSKHSFFLRYISLIKKLRSGSASFEEIQKHLRREEEIQDIPLTISKRTLQRDINEIRSLFNIDIQCNKRHEYFIDSGEDEAFNERTLEAFDLFSSLNLAENISPFLHFDQRKARGTEHMYGLLHAIKKRCVTELMHCKFRETKPTKRILEPYALKESQGRWYLVAKDRKDNQIKTFGLDRISEVHVLREKFSFPKDFSVHEKFKDCFGIIDLKSAATKKVILQFAAEQGEYILAQPLHSSQQTIERNKEFVTVQIDVKVTYDLIREILSHGDNVQVLSPESLRIEIRETLKNMIYLYRAY